MADPTRVLPKRGVILTPQVPGITAKKIDSRHGFIIRIIILPRRLINRSISRSADRSTTSVSLKKFRERHDIDAVRQRNVKEQAFRSSERRISKHNGTFSEKASPVANPHPSHPRLSDLLIRAEFAPVTGDINPESLRNWTARTYSGLVTVKDMILRGYIPLARRCLANSRRKAVGRNICTLQRIIRPSTVYLLRVLLRTLTSTVSHYYS